MVSADCHVTESLDWLAGVGPEDRDRRPHMLGDHPRILPMALIAAGDQDGAMREIEWAASHGYRGVCLGNAPTYGPIEYGKLQYNDPSFEPMWSLLEETDLVITFHVSTG